MNLAHRVEEDGLEVGAAGTAIKTALHLVSSIARDAKSSIVDLEQLARRAYLAPSSSTDAQSAEMTPSTNRGAPPDWDLEYVKAVNQQFTIIGEWIKLTGEWLRMQADRAAAQAEFNDGVVEMFEILRTAEDITVTHVSAAQSRLRKLQDQFVAMQEMFGMRLARAERMSPPQLSLIQGGRDGDES